MYNLSVDEISMVDGGGDGSVGTIIGNIGCGIAGLAVGAATKSVQAGTAAGILCSQMLSNSANAGQSGHNGGAYHGHAGGMDGSSTGFGR
ncbi:Bacteriocin-like protein [Vibrio crassostreae]|uniref:hypothetical protein n=1 Tax=Vibrio crassostreae TaxID=246167 RepID=UPI0010484AC2|nr:hypothetical protein [Vibrio crassostreae]TCN90357.1 hypothetical protein EDB37_10057 [Vibrio crassostreae]CAK2537901.1 Bacteriocin-like protein [Vibrio crassostreae]CAK2550839.1 Bacteriocin-like protein [Vibrio crassostreae]CAK2636499.1 Bacteriocin-like protein [Vibrio crassostreae]CAK3125355.1 Bacteriocin-like protein [Vibrio crassostreae]